MYETVLGGGEPEVPLMIVRGNARGVDGFAAAAQPLAHLIQDTDRRFFDETGRRRADTQRQAAALRRNLRQHADHAACALVTGVRDPAPVIAEGDAGFPGMVHLAFRDGALGRLVVLVRTLDGPVHTDQARAHFTCLRQHFIQAYLIAPDPAAVQPEDVQFAVSARGELGQLVLRELHITLPPVRMHLPPVIGIPVGRGVIGIPEAGMVPVRLGKIGAGKETLRAESLEDIFGRILAGIGGKGTVGDAEVRVLRVEETEPVVVLRGEDHILHAGPTEDFGPLRRVEIDGIELL